MAPIDCELSQLTTALSESFDKDDSNSFCSSIYEDDSSAGETYYSDLDRRSIASPSMSFQTQDLASQSGASSSLFSKSSARSSLCASVPKAGKIMACGDLSTSSPIPLSVIAEDNNTSTTTTSTSTTWTNNNILGEEGQTSGPAIMIESLLEAAQDNLSHETSIESQGLLDENVSRTSSPLTTTSVNNHQTVFRPPVSPPLQQPQRFAEIQVTPAAEQKTNIQQQSISYTKQPCSSIISRAKNALSNKGLKLDQARAIERSMNRSSHAETSSTPGNTKSASNSTSTSTSASSRIAIYNRATATNTPVSKVEKENKPSTMGRTMDHWNRRSNQKSNDQKSASASTPFSSTSAGNKWTSKSSPSDSNVSVKPARNQVSKQSIGTEHTSETSKSTKAPVIESRTSRIEQQVNGKKMKPVWSGTSNKRQVMVTKLSKSSYEPKKSCDNIAKGKENNMNDTASHSPIKETIQKSNINNPIGQKKPMRPLTPRPKEGGTQKTVNNIDNDSCTKDSMQRFDRSVESKVSEDQNEFEQRNRLSQEGGKDCTSLSSNSHGRQWQNFSPKHSNRIQNTDNCSRLSSEQSSLGKDDSMENLRIKANMLLARDSSRRSLALLKRADQLLHQATMALKMSDRERNNVDDLCESPTESTTSYADPDLFLSFTTSDESNNSAPKCEKKSRVPLKDHIEAGELCSDFGVVTLHPKLHKLVPEGIHCTPSSRRKSGHEFHGEFPENFDERVPTPYRNVFQTLRSYNLRNEEESPVDDLLRLPQESTKIGSSTDTSRDGYFDDSEQDSMSTLSVGSAVNVTRNQMDLQTPSSTISNSRSPKSAQSRVRFHRSGMEIQEFYSNEEANRIIRSPRASPYHGRKLKYAIDEAGPSKSCFSFLFGERQLKKGRGFGNRGSPKHQAIESRVNGQFMSPAPIHYRRYQTPSTARSSTIHSVNTPAMGEWDTSIEI